MPETEVTLKEWVYESGDSGGFEEVVYPYRPLKEFIEWMMNTVQWQEDPKGSIVYNRWLVLKRQLTDARNAAADLPIVQAALDLVTEELEEERDANAVFRATSAAEIFAGQQRERVLGMQLISERTAASTEITRLNTALTISMQESDAWQRAASPGALTQIWKQGRAALVAVAIVLAVSN